MDSDTIMEAACIVTDGNLDIVAEVGCLEWSGFSTGGTRPIVECDTFQ